MFNYIPILLFMSALLLKGCSPAPNEKEIVVTEITHFRISAGPEGLSLPVFINYLDERRIAYEAALAENYFEKLSKIYDVKSFSLLNSRRVPTMVTPVELSTHPMNVYSFADENVEIEVALTSLSAVTAQYRFRMKNATEPWREHILTIPLGQSCSVGVISDTTNYAGHLLTLGMKLLKVTPDLSAEQAIVFLAGDSNSNRSSKVRLLTREERACLVEIFGKEVLADQTDIASEPDRIDLIVDILPEIEGGIGEIGKVIVYPSSAKRDGFEGRVLVGIKVEASGESSNLHIVKSARADLDSAAVKALQSIRFKPARLKGVPVTIEVVVPIEFKLE